MREAHLDNQVIEEGLNYHMQKPDSINRWQYYRPFFFFLPLWILLLKNQNLLINLTLFRFFLSSPGFKLRCMLNLHHYTTVFVINSNIFTEDSSIQCCQTSSILIPSTAYICSSVSVPWHSHRNAIYARLFFSRRFHLRFFLFSFPGCLLPNIHMALP